MVSETTKMIDEEEESDEFNSDAEAHIEAVETGKVKLTEYASVDDYIKHIDELLDE